MVKTIVNPIKINPLNKTSSYFKQPKRLDFTVMGLNQEYSDFLNWTLSQYDNLQLIKECKTLEKRGTQTVIHHDFEASIMIDDIIRHKKA